MAFSHKSFSGAESTQHDSAFSPGFKIVIYGYISSASILVQFISGIKAFAVESGMITGTITKVPYPKLDVLEKSAIPLLKIMPSSPESTTPKEFGSPRLTVLAG